MPDETTDSLAVDDSVSDSFQDTAPDTNAVEGHTESPADDGSSHVEWVKANIDKIPEDVRRELGKQAQPEFSRKINQLNLLSQQREQNAQSALRDAGVELPAGVSVSDLMYENGGKGFTDLLKSSIQKEFAPVKEAISKAEMNQKINQGITFARQTFPDVESNWEEAVRRIDSDRDLSVMAMDNNAAALPYVVDYVATKIAQEKAAKEIKELRAKLDGTKVLAKTGTSSTKSNGAGGSGKGSGAPVDRSNPGAIRKSYERAAMAALESLK